MSWNSTLQRRTPLRAKTGFKPSQGFKPKPPSQHPTDGMERPQKGSKMPRRAKTERGSLIERLDTMFSLYIRLRDAMTGGRTRCISCGRVLPFEQMQCGHYYTRHNMSVRWDERNANAECAFDNCYNDNHLEGYRANLIAKIGQESFDALRVRSNQARKWSDEELRGMIRHYTAEVKRLSKEKCFTYY